MTNPLTLDLDMTEAFQRAITSLGRERRDGLGMAIDLFEDAAWRKKIVDPSGDGRVAVTLSTGRTVDVDTRLLAYLRLLADELAKDGEPRD